MPCSGSENSDPVHGESRGTMSRGVHNVYSLDVSAFAGGVQPITTSVCEVCGQQAAIPRFLIEGSGFTIVQCTSCGLGVLWPPPSTDQIRSFYPRDYYGSNGFKFQEFVEPMVRLVGIRGAWFVARLIGRGGKILDVGCGRGITLRSLANFGCEPHGFEVSSDAVQGVDPRIAVTVADSLAEAEYPSGHFDGVLMWHVLEHVPNPREVLIECWRILKPGGVLVVAVPNFSSIQARWSAAAWFHLDPPRHLFHFPATALEQLLRQIGFVPQSRHHFSLRQNPFGWIQSGQNKLHWLPRNGLYAMLHRRRPRGQAPFSLLTRLQLWVCFALFAGPALLLSVSAAAFRSGATIHVVTRKPL